ncbi:MAG: hypothetical protein AAFV25_21945, partial [Bacteroidota bacterium]
PALQASELGGSFEPAPRPRLWPQKVLEKSYQKALERHLWLENPVAPFLVRSRTHVNLLLFDQLPKGNVIKGEKGHFFSESDCYAVMGSNDIGRDSIEEICHKLEVVTQYFAADSIPVLLLVPPAKPRMYPDALPEAIRTHPNGGKEIAEFLSVLREKDIPLIDYGYLREQQQENDAPLYPFGGLHWNHYGIGLAVDSLRNRVMELLDRSVAQMQWRDEIEWRTELASTDRELINGGNFLVEPPLQAMPYPTFRFPKSGKTNPPRVFVAGDSFYMLMYNEGIHKGLWAKESVFAYYFRVIHPPKMRGKMPMSGPALLASLSEKDLILISCYDSNLHRLGFGFVEKLYDLISK